MRKYIIRRLLISIPTVWAAATLIFLMMRVLPGDVAAVILGEVAMPETVAIVRERLGLNEPLYRQYLDWLWGLVRLDLGHSLFQPHLAVATAIRRAYPVTLNVAVLSMLLMVVIGVPLGVISAVRQDRWIDYVLRVVSIWGLATPGFWAAILLLLFLVLIFNWTPEPGYVSPFENPWENIKKMIWPALAVALHGQALLLRITRSSMLEVLREDYVRTARAKGLVRRVAVVRHALPNALLPVVTVAGLQFAAMVDGLLVTEVVFNLPGIGRLMVTSIYSLDYTVVQTLFVFTATAVVMTNLAVDLLYGFIDPRVRYE